MDEPGDTAVTSGQLVALLDEFFLPHTGSARRAEIELLLSSFKERGDCIVECVRMLASPSSCHVELYALNCLITCNGQWMALSEHGFRSLRERLVEVVQARFHETTTQPFIRSKLCETLAVIALLRWDEQMESTLMRWFDRVACVRLAIDVVLALCNACAGNRVGNATGFYGFMQARGLGFVDRVLAECREAMLNDERDASRTMMMTQCVQVLRGTLELVSIPIPDSRLVAWLQVLAGLVAPVPCGDGELVREAIDTITTIARSSRVTSNSPIARQLVEIATQLMSRVNPVIREKWQSHSLIMFLNSVITSVLPKLPSSDCVFMSFFDSLVTFTTWCLHEDVELLQSVLHDVWQPWLDTLEQCASRWESWSGVERVVDWLVAFVERVSEIRALASAQYLQLPSAAIALDSRVDEMDEECDERDWPAFCMLVARIVAQLAARDAHRDRLFHHFANRILDNFSSLLVPSRDANEIDWLVGQLRCDRVIFAQLSHLFTDHDELDRTFTANLHVVERISTALMHCRDARASESSSPVTLSETDLLLCAQSRCAWLSCLYAITQRTGTLNMECSSLISSWIELAIDAMLAQAWPNASPSTVVQSAAALLYSLLIVVRPHAFALSIPSLTAFYDFLVTQKACAAFAHDTMRAVFVMMCGYLLLPWHQATVDEQEWPRRRRILQSLIEPLLMEINAIIGDTQSTALLEITMEDTRELPVLLATLNGVLDTVIGQSAAVSSTLSTALGDYCLVPLRALRRCRDAGLFVLLVEHTARLFRALALHAKPQYTSHMILLITHLSEERECDNDEQRGDSAELAKCALGGLAEILITVVSSQSRATHAMMDEIVQLLMDDHIVNEVHTSSSLSCESLHSFYRLLAAVLHSRWRYFFPASTITQKNEATNMSMNATTSIELWQPDIVQEMSLETIARRCNQFIVLVSIYYIPVFACDAKMDLARIVIASLLALNNLALFSKPFFINHLARELLIAIIDALITGVMASLRDEMIELAWAIFSTGAPTLEDDFEQHVLATVVCRRLGRDRLSTAIWTQIAFRRCDEKWQFEKEIRELALRLQSLTANERQMGELATRAAATTLSP